MACVLLKSAVVAAVLTLLSAGAMANSNTANSLASVETSATEFTESQTTTLQVAPTGAILGSGGNYDRSPTKRLPMASASEAPGAFDWSTLICLAFGLCGLLWIRRRTAAL